MAKSNFICCPHCGGETIPKSKVLLDGWTTVGTILVCALCGGKLSEDSREPAAAANAIPPSPETETRKRDALRALLGGETYQKPQRIAVSPGECRFCRDCRHFVKHPFLTRCALTREAVNPMDDCEQFTPKPMAENNSNQSDEQDATKQEEK